MTQLPHLNIRTLLNKYDLHPRKRLGQNFLIDDSYLQKIIEIAEIGSEDTILEIGPGVGNLTRHLAVTAKSVVAVEIDPYLFPVLTEVLSGFKNIQLVQGDILEVKLQDLLNCSNYLVVANIPYNITSALIRHLLECQLRPRRLILTIQDEVANRICAKPGDLSLLALSVQVYGFPQIKLRIPASTFLPPPKVNSAVICVDIYDTPVIPAPLLQTFFSLIKAGFSQKRKTLKNSLSAGLHIPPSQTALFLTSAGIDPTRRAETLSIDEWQKLSLLYGSKK